MKRQRWWRMAGVAALGTAIPFAASAQDMGGELGETGSLQPASRFGVELLLGGGYSDFVHESARDYTDGAGTWNLRAVVGSRLPIGFEAAYIGSAQGINVAGLDTDAYLLGNGLEGSVRFALPIEMGRWLVAPFATAGIGWNYYSLESSDANSTFVLADDNNFTPPLALGLDGIYKGFTMSARFTYRPSYDDDMFLGSDLTTWGLNANLGFEF